jgi:heat shock protein 4
VFVQVQDISPFSYELSSDEGPKGVVFPKGQPIPNIAILRLQRTNLFHLEVSYANPQELPPGTDPKISCFTV